MRRITLVPGAVWDFDDGPFGLQSNLAGRYLESGNVMLNGPDGEMAFEPGQPFNLSSMRPAGFMNVIQNAGREPAVIIELLVYGENEALPEPPMGSTAELIGQTQFQQPAGSITILNLMRITVNGAGSPAVRVSGQQQTVFIAVEAGTMAMDPRPGMIFTIGAIGEAVPEASPTIATGETWGITLGSGKTVSGDNLADAVSVAGDQPLTTLSLAIEHESPVDTAQNRIVSDPLRWELPGSADQATLSLRELTLEPGSAWTHDQASATHIWVRSGELTLSLSHDGSPQIVPAGTTATASEDGPVTFSNQGSEPVTLIEGMFLAGRSESPLVSDIPSGVAVQVLATGIVSISGTVETMLYTDSAQTGTVGSEYVRNGARLVSVMEGPLLFSPLGGPIDVLGGFAFDGAGSLETLETLGDPITLETGDAVLAHPGSGFSVEASGNEPNQFVALLIAPIGDESEPSASPVADADVASTDGQMTDVTPGDCTIVPRSIEEFTAIFSDPYAEGTPQAGMRDRATTGMPADQASVDGITDTVRQIVACNAPGTHLKMYSLYSANMLRFHAAAGTLTLDDITGLDQLEPPASSSPVSGFIAVESVVVFPDGRVGAMVNANGELAYLTFVFEDGRWLIDFWDDQISDSAATPVA
jgi:quercetin dioxygenase-like cupin family protein